MKKTALLAAVALIAAGPAFAHTGHGADGAFAGFAHPFLGLDHLLAMVALGVWASWLGTADRRAIWAAPAAFVAAMALGGALGMAGIAPPIVEIGIAGSVLLLGALLLAARHLNLGAAAATAGVFALFHGAAHGLELPAGVSPWLYSAGFLVATAALHGVGVMLGAAARRFGGTFGVRAVGGAVALGGLALVAGA